jgi:biotin carboxylase
MVECCIKIALGEKIKLPVKKSGGAAIRYFPSKPGRLHSICLPDRELNPNIQEIVFTKNIGDIVNPIKSSNDRIGYVIAKGETPSQAILNCENAIRSTNISIL